MRLLLRIALAAGVLALLGLVTSSVLGIALMGSNRMGASPDAFAILGGARAVLGIIGLAVSVAGALFLARPRFLPSTGVSVLGVAMLVSIGLGATLRGEPTAPLAWATAVLCGIAAMTHLYRALPRQERE